MPFVGGGHIWLLLILLAIVLIVKGPGKLPEVGSALGRGIKEFKKATTDTPEVSATVTATAPATPEHPVS